MRWNPHSPLAGTHAFLNASNYHWIRYTDEKLDNAFLNALAARRGTELHILAQQLIRLKVRLPEVENTLNLYVNDAIGFRLRPEQTVYYSPNCYGTADAIGFSQKTLRIFDLKTGEIDGSMDQLQIYAALFCLEYHQSPLKIQIELRIYQKNKATIFEPDPDSIFHIMDRIKVFDQRLNEIRLEASE